MQRAVREAELRLEQTLENRWELRLTKLSERFAVRVVRVAMRCIMILWSEWAACEVESETAVWWLTAKPCRMRLRWCCCHLVACLLWLGGWRECNASTVVGVWVDQDREAAQGREAFVRKVLLRT